MRLLRRPDSYCAQSLSRATLPVPSASTCLPLSPLPLSASLCAHGQESFWFQLLKLKVKTASASLLCYVFPEALQTARADEGTVAHELIMETAEHRTSQLTGQIPHPAIWESQPTAYA